MRNRFDEQLFELNREIIEMGAMCEEAIASAVKALTDGDIELAGRVKANGSSIDQMERDIESRCMKLLLHQQPVARDLRLISATLKLITLRPTLVLTLLRIPVPAIQLPQATLLVSR